MKNLNLVIALLAFNIFTNAQPVLTVADFPAEPNISCVQAQTTFAPATTPSWQTPFNFTVTSSTPLINGSEYISLPVTAVPNSSIFPTATSASKTTRNGQIYYSLYETTAMTHKLIARSYNNVLYPENIILFSFPFQLNSIGYDGEYVIYGTINTPLENYPNVIKLFSSTTVNFNTTEYTTYYSTNPCKMIYRISSFFGEAGANGWSTFYEYLPYSLSDEKFSSNFYSISPNPTSGDFRISTNNYESAGLFVTVYDLLGKIVIPTEQITSEIQTVNSNALSAGLYIVKVSDKNNQVIKTEKIIKC